MLVPKVQLIPSQEDVMNFLRKAGALREGRFAYPDGKQSQYYFQMPMAMRYHGDARVLNVALSRKFRKEPEVLAALPNCAIVAPSSGGIPVAFGIREALDADQIFWAEKDDKRNFYFRQYMDVKGTKCIIVDDMVRSGSVMTRFVNFVREAGAEVIACGSLVHFKDAKLNIGDIPYYSLLDIDARFYNSDEWPADKANLAVEKVWF
ncbi:MAG: phosphoribosyltransferase family protein [Acidobacteriota bacterium]